MKTIEAWIESIGDNPCDYCKYPQDLMDSHCSMCCYNHGVYEECRRFLPSMFDPKNRQDK